MSRTYKLYLNDILTAAAKIERFIAGLSLEQFQLDDMRVDSVLMNLLIIGEAVKALPDDVKVNNPDVRWRDIGRFRDRLVHHYFGLDIGIIWEIVTIHVPNLQRRTQMLLDELDE